MDENAVLVGFMTTPVLLGALLFWLFRAKRIHRSKNRVALLFGNIAVFGFLCSLIALFSELYLRYYYDETDSFAFTLTSEKWFERHYHLNSVGFRDSREYELQRSSRKRRISFIGDSFTAGHGIPNVEDRFANIIRKKRPQWEVHVLAKNGGDTGPQLDFILSMRQIGYELDVLVLVYCLNDIADIVPEWKTVKERVYEKPWFVSVMQGSYFVDFLYHRCVVAYDPDVRDFYQFLTSKYEGPTWERQQLRFRRIRNEVLSRRGTLFVATFPFVHAIGPSYEYRAVHARLDKAWKELGVPHLDLLSVYEGRDPSELVVNAYDSHPNEFAHALAADAIIAFLDEQLNGRQPPR